MTDHRLGNPDLLARATLSVVGGTDTAPDLAAQLWDMGTAMSRAQTVRLADLAAPETRAAARAGQDAFIAALASVAKGYARRCHAGDMPLPDLAPSLAVRMLLAAALRIRPDGALADVVSALGEVDLAEHDEHDHRGLEIAYRHLAEAHFEASERAWRRQIEAEQAAYDAGQPA